MSRDAARADIDRPPVTAIVQPGRNCWRVDRADRFSSIQDAADYFRLVRQALLAARETVFILGWDLTATVDLDPGAPARRGAHPAGSAAQVRRAETTPPPLLHPDLGLRRPLHARAGSVHAMAPRLAHPGTCPIRLRRPPSGRRQPSSEDRGGRRSARVLRRRRSDQPPMGYERASGRGTREGHTARQGLWSVSRGAGAC